MVAGLPCVRSIHDLLRIDPVYFFPFGSLTAPLLW